MRNDQGCTTSTATDPRPVVCPRCGLTLRVRAPWVLTMTCPRCDAYAGQTVRLVPESRHQRRRAREGAPGDARRV